MTVADAHCHFFSAGFFRALARERAAEDQAEALPGSIGWEPPGADETLAARWVAELDGQGVTRAMLIASVHGDEGAVAQAARLYPSRIVGAFMVNPAAPDAGARLAAGLDAPHVRTVCLFPAMHRVPLDHESVEAVFVAAQSARAVVFVHCGALSVGARKKLGLASRFDLRLGDPLAVAKLAVRFPDVPVIIPHFGAGLFLETLMAADAAPNILLDTSSSNRWIRYHAGLSLRDAFARAVDVVGPGRLLFGTDSSFFPRGWQRPVFEAQESIVQDLGLDSAARDAIFGGNFARVFGTDNSVDGVRS